MNFWKLTEQILNESNTTENSFKKSSGNGVLGGLVTDTGNFNKGHAPALKHGVHVGQGSHVDYNGRNSYDDTTTPRPAQNKMGRHTRGNSLKSGRSGKAGKSRKTGKKK